jgi:cell division protein FtsB
MGCEGEVIVEMTPTEAVSMLEKAWQENKRLRQENATLTAERDEARQQVKRCKTMIDDYIREVAKQKVAIIEAMRMINNLNDIVRNLQKGRPT